MRSVRAKTVLLLLAGLLALGLLTIAWVIGPGPSEAQQGTMHNCPQSGKWAISVWDGDDGTGAEQAFATCDAGAVDAAYYLDPEDQTWQRWFAGRPLVSTLETLNDMQGVIALGGAAAPPLSPTPTATPTPTPTPTTTATLPPTPDSFPYDMTIVAVLPFLFLGNPNYDCVPVGLSMLHCDSLSLDWPDYSCWISSTGSWVNCNASSFDWPHYSCWISSTGSWVNCNASSFDWPHYSCWISSTGSWVNCNASSFDWPHYSCWISSTGSWVDCSTSSFDWPDFTCTVVAHALSCGGS